jgi:hypothetical protein
MNALTEFKENSNTVYSDVTTYNQYMKMAECLSKTELLPTQYRGKPADCLIIIDVARQIGASPLFVAQNMYIIKGSPSWSAQYSASVIKTNFTNVKVELQGEGLKRGCRIIATDKNGNLCEGTRVTIEMAKQEGWFSKTGSKWQTMPDQMLIYRAYSFFARAYCPDKLLGIHDEFENVDISKIEQRADNPFEEVIDAEVVQEPEQTETQKTDGILVCEKCGCEIDQKVYDYSTKVLKQALCYKCQKEVKKC